MAKKPGILKKNLNSDTLKKLLEVYLAEHEILWEEIITRLNRQKYVLHISSIVLVGIITTALAKTYGSVTWIIHIEWVDILLAGPVIGFIATAVLLRQWQGWTVITYYFKQRLQPGYLIVLAQLNGSKEVSYPIANGSNCTHKGPQSPSDNAEVIPIDWINFVNEESRDQTPLDLRMLRLLWVSDYLLPFALGSFCMALFIFCKYDRLTEFYMYSLCLNLIILLITLWLIRDFTRWRSRFIHK